jgi:hypothetical protein
MDCEMICLEFGPVHANAFGGRFLIRSSRPPLVTAEWNPFGMLVKRFGQVYDWLGGRQSWGYV